MRVDVILRHKGNDVFSADPKLTIQEAADLLAKHKIGALMVRDGNGPIVGVLSERDIARGLAAHKAAALNKSIGDLMTPLSVTCTSMDTLDHIMDVMTSKRVRHIPVLDDDDLKGIVSIGDVVKHRLSEVETESDALRQYIAAG